jgi:hypothetical protein
MATNDGQQDRTRTGAGSSTSGSTRSAEDRPGADEAAGVLIDAGLAFWSRPECTEDDRIKHLTSRIEPLYQALVLEFNTSADLCAERFDGLRLRHERWRWVVIIATGTVAIINSVAALLAARGPDPGGLEVDPRLSVFLAAAAAIAAVALTILANLENFGNYLERGYAYRDARELFVTASRDATRLWEAHVSPYWGRPEGCVNATELYRRLCRLDAELRQKAKDLTQPKTSDG